MMRSEGKEGEITVMVDGSAGFDQRRMVGPGCISQGRQPLLHARLTVDLVFGEQK